MDLGGLKVVRVEEEGGGKRVPITGSHGDKRIVLLLFYRTGSSVLSR